MPQTRKIIVWVAVSADGFIARRDESVDWLDSVKGDYGMMKFWKSIDTVLWGRRTYDMALAFQAKGVKGSEFDTSMKNYVFTRGAAPASQPKGIEFVRDSLKDFARRIRKAKGKNVWIMGGGGLFASFLDAGEIDEFIMLVIPKFIGEGIPLLEAGRRTVPLKLRNCEKFPDGVVKLHYAIERGSGRRKRA